LAQLSLSANAARPKVIGWHDVSCSEAAHSAQVKLCSGWY